MDERLQELMTALTYDPETGIFRWAINNNRTGGTVQVGRIAGSLKPCGYVKLKFHGKMYQAHRLAWAFVHGAWPTQWIDHKDGNPGNNSISNLRLADCTDNNRNRKVNKTSTTGLKGVTPMTNGTGFFSQIRCGNGIRKYLGFFSTAEAAHEAYRAAAVENHGEFVRNG